MNKTQAYDLIQRIIPRYQVDPDKICMEADLVNDLGMDSLTIVDVVEEAEKKSKCPHISNDDFMSIKTVGDLVNAISDPSEHQ